MPRVPGTFPPPIRPSRTAQLDRTMPRCHLSTLRQPGQTQAQARDGERDGAPDEGSGGDRSPLPVVPGARRHLVHASRFGAPVRPTIEPTEPGQGCHCHRQESRRTVPLTPTRDQAGGHLGCRSRNQRRTIDFEADSSRWISDLDHEPSNWTSANRPGGPSGRQDLSRRFIQRIDRPSVSEGDRRVFGSGHMGRRMRGERQAERPRRSALAWTRRATPRMSKSAWMTRAAETRSGS